MDANDPRRQGLATAKAVLDGATPRVAPATRPARARPTATADAAAPAAAPLDPDTDHERLVRRLAELEDEVTRLRAALDTIAAQAAAAAAE